jgi:DNA-binding MarR family transcriptional regulator
LKTQSVEEISRDLLSLIPIFQEKLIKPSEDLFYDGMSRLRFFTIGIIKSEGPISMTALSSKMEMPKQQMTKIINRLCESNLVERTYDQKDRRIIRIAMTPSGNDYIDGYIKKLLIMTAGNIEKLSDQDIRDMKSATETLVRVLPKLGRMTL